MSSDDQDDEDEGGEDDSPATEEQIREALRAVRSQDGPSLSDVLLLVNASLERKTPSLCLPALVDAVMAKWTCDRDFANGGADQFAWNNGSELTRKVAADFRAVGALENADLLDRLAAELDAYRAQAAELGEDGDAVRLFLGYRKRVGGPFFRIPEPGEELGEVLVEHAIAHAKELPDPDGPLPGFDRAQ
jgi:hypothetical protein